MNRMIVLPTLVCLMVYATPPVPAQESTDKNAAKQSFGDATVKNPYYSGHQLPPWKLWFEDDTAVVYSPEPPRGNPREEKQASRTLSPPPLERRLYPDLASDEPDPRQLYPFTLPQTEPTAAGWWDDAVASLDGNHVRLRNTYQFGNQKVPLHGQLIQVLQGSPRFEERSRIGINFAWQSYAEKGHHLLLGEQTIRRMEETFTFANCLYASPGFLSRTDVMPDRMVDSYDGLFGHYYNSLGQSGSELPAVAKMLYAGAHLPRRTKNLMKTHGVYPLAMLTIFKATLPYRDSSEMEVPYENELRHRPSYASAGNSVQERYVSRELEYHLYDQQTHVQRMVQMAKNMNSPPPVTLLRLIDAMGSSSRDNLVRSSTYTSIRIHGEPGERIETTVDLGDSYDLATRPLTFHAERVYPEQRNIEVRIDDQGKANLVATHDENYPSGRFPVILWVENGTECPGNPVFVNFHWPACDQSQKPSYFAPYKKPFVSEEDLKKFASRGAAADPNVEVNRNDKPIIQTNLQETTIKAAVGETVSFQLQGKDPEGFPTRFYQWSGDVGTIREDRFMYTPTHSERGKTLPVRFVCSDGTGAYCGLTVRIQVE